MAVDQEISLRPCYPWEQSESWNVFKLEAIGENDETIGNHTCILYGVQDMMIFKYADIYDMMITIGGLAYYMGCPQCLERGMHSWGWTKKITAKYDADHWCCAVVYYTLSLCKVFALCCTPLLHTEDHWKIWRRSLVLCSCILYTEFM